MNLVYWVTCRFSQVLCKLFYHHKIYGKEHLFAGRAIIAPNHASFLEPVIMGFSFFPEEISSLARKTLFEKWPLSYLLPQLGVHPVQGSAQDIASFKLVCQLLKNNKKILMFPEGTRCFDGNLQPLKAGVSMLAIKNSAPIIPVYVHGGFEVWSRFHRFPKMTGTTATVFGSPIPYSLFDHLDKKEAQLALTAKLQESLINLKKWYDEGAIGSPP